MKTKQKFDFREWMQSEVQMSQEAQAVYDAALAIARYYHNHEAYVDGRNWNDSFYDIKNAIMAKDATAYQQRNTNKDRRVTKVKTAQGGDHGVGSLRGKASKLERY